MKTTDGQIRSALRMLWLRSRERQQAIKDHDATCTDCGRKRSTAKGKVVKIEVHHKDGIEWQPMFDAIRKNLLDGDLGVLCKECHKKETYS